MSETDTGKYIDLRRYAAAAGHLRGDVIYHSFGTTKRPTYQFLPTNEAEQTKKKT